MSEKIGTFFMALVLWVVFPGSWIYYIWACFMLREFGYLIAGILIPPFGVALGLWSILFGVPGFIINYS